MKRIVILTGSELRHTFFRKYLALYSGIKVVNTFCEGTEKSLQNLVSKQDSNENRDDHLKAREQSERDFFELYVKQVQDKSSPVYLPKGDINLPEHYQKIIDLNPDLLISYGCSIIKGPLLDVFGGRFINVHLGLSPYYRGSGTNFWPLVNAEPEFVGATYMHIDAGIDTGEIIHQLRAHVEFSDTPHTIGNRLIKDMTDEFAKLIVNFDKLDKMEPIPESDSDKLYKNKDFSEESVKQIYDNFAQGMISKYLSEKQTRWQKSPIIKNPAIK